jgi:hypothetical protein
VRVSEKGVGSVFPWACQARRGTGENRIPPIFTKGGYLDSGIQLIYTNTKEGRCLVLRIESPEIDDHILDKIESKHSVSFQEVEEACLSEKRHVRRSREGLYKLFSQTAAGRYVLIVLANLGRGSWKVVTAR